MSNEFEISANLRQYLRRSGARSISIARIEGFLSSDIDTTVSVGTTTRLIYSTEVLIDDPQVYLRLNEASSSDPALDSSGNNNDGTYTGGVTNVAGGLYYDNDTAMEFDGTGYVSCPGPSLHTNGSLEGIFKISAGSAPLIRDASTGSAGWAMGHDAGSGTFAIRAGGIDYDTNINMVGFNDIWTHFLMRKEADRLDFYINGILAYTHLDVSTAAASATTWYVMKDGLDSGKLTGRADEIAIYNTAVAADRPRQHYRAFAGVSG